VKETAANKQHRSILGVLRAVAALTWSFKHINFIVGNCWAIVESDFYTKLNEFDVQE